MLTRRQFGAGLLAATAINSPALALRRLRAHGRDQIVFITADDFFDAFYYLRRLGVRVYAPNFFKLARMGVTFREAHCTTPLCCPSRAAFMSGRSELKTGVTSNTTPWFDKFDIHSTFPGILAAAGYRCFMFGKTTHDGPLAGPGRIWKDSGICETYVGSIRSPGVNTDEVTTSAAVRCVRNTLKSATEKWLLMVGLESPHHPRPDRPELTPRFPPDSIRLLNWDGDPKSPCFISNGGFANLNDEGLKIFVQGYLADVWAMDIELGRILTNLRTSGLDPTIIFAGDHGFSLGDHDELGKLTLWDEGTRTPTIIKYPGCPAGMVVSETVSLLDLAPTIVHHAGLPIPAHFDGQSLLPIIVKGQKRLSGATSFMEGGHVSFRSNDHRITRYAPCPASGGQPTWELYDNTLDPTSSVNLWDEPGFEALQDNMIARLDASIARLS